MTPLKCFFPLALLVACTDKSTSDEETTEDGSAAVDMSAEWYYSFGYDGAPSLDCVAYYKSMPAVNSTLCPDCDVVGFVQYDYEEGTCNDGSAQVTVPQDVGFAFDMTNYLVYEYNMNNDEWNDFGNFTNTFSCRFSPANNSEPTASGTEVTCSLSNTTNIGHTLQFDWRFTW